MCLLPFSLTQPIILKHSTIERDFQKPPFCVAKVWFLACKKWVFALQKYGFCFLRECFFVLQYIIPCPRNSTKWRCVFPSLILQFIVSHPRNSTKWCCNSHHFAISKPFDSDCKTGAMNRPLRFTECSLPYICVINGYFGIFVAIHLRYPFRYFYLLYPTFCHVHPVGVGVRFIVPVPT